MTLLLAGDIGGTKTSLALVSSERGPFDPLVEATFPSHNYPDLQSLAHKFLEQTGAQVDHAAFGVAGPVVNGQVVTTNLPWRMSEEELTDALQVKSVYLLNDLLAIANAVPHLQPRDLFTLNQGQVIHGGAIAVVAPGTGLGEAYLVWDGRRYIAQPSEGGHADFAPMDDLQLGLLRYLLERHSHVSYELVCSGMGLPNIYRYLRDMGHAPEPEWLRTELAAAPDLTALIVNSALRNDPPSALCTTTLEMFVTILGAEAGNMALKVLATGGVFIGGGIPPRILAALQGEGFINAFRNKGRFGAAMAKLPIHVILNPKAALLGAAYAGLSQG
jgi:glucokinase